MKRLTVAGVLIYAATWAVVCLMYALAWITDFERGE